MNRRLSIVELAPDERGRDTVRALYEGLLRAFPDLQIQVKKRYVAEDTVVAEVVLKGTQRESFLGVPPTGRYVEIPTCAIFRFDATDGKSKFTSLKYEDVWIRVVGPVAIVRFHWLGEQVATADGKKSSTNLHILMNWVKQGSDWKLLSRASTKLYGGSGPETRR